MPSFFFASRLVLRVFCVLLFVLCFWCGSGVCGYAQTQPDMVWEQTGGPEGSYIHCFAVIGTSIFVATRDGVFRSTVNGTSWTAVNTGLMNNTFVRCLAVSGSTLFVGTADGRVYRSINNGASWAAASTGLTNAYIYSLAVSGSTIFAGTIGGGVFRSTDNGASWTAANTGLTSTQVWSFVVSGSTLFAGTDGGGVYRSTDNGASWTAINRGLTIRRVFSLAVSGGTLFAGTGGGGVFRSTDNGASWTAVNTGLTNTYIDAIAVSGSTLFVGTGTEGSGVFCSTDNGASWTAVNTGLTNTIILSLAVSGNTVFAGTNGGGVFRATIPTLPPILTVSPANLNFATSSTLQYTLEGRNIVNRVVAIPSQGILLFDEVSQRWVRYLEFQQSAGMILRTILVRLDSGVVWNGQTTGRINHTLGDVSNTIEAVVTIMSGIERPPVSLTVTPSEPLPLGVVRLGAVAASQSYRLVGRNLFEPVVITAPPGIEILDTLTNTWRPTLRLAQNADTLTARIVVRLDASQIRSVRDSIINTSGQARAIVRVIGNVLPLPQLTASPLQPENLDTIIHFDPSRGAAYTLTGSFLDAPVSMSAPQGILLFDQASKSWTQALTLQPDAAGSLMQTVSVRLDSSRLGFVQDSIRNVSGSTSASVSVRGAVVPLTLPPGAETTLELRFVGQQPLRIRDTARVQIWLKDSRLLTPRLVGRFLRSLRVAVRIDTNNLAVLGISSLTPRARIESPQRVPADTPLYTILAERPDTVSMGNLLLAEMTVLATLGATTTNTIRIADPVQWLGSDGSITPTSAVRIVREPESVGVQIRPLFLRRSSTIALIAPNPSSESVQLFYTLSPETGAVTSAVTLTISDAAGRTMKRIELGARQTGVAQQETVWLSDLPTGGYVLTLVTPSETLPWRLDVVR